jgi:galactokinase/mevalonate kinase-like predicted kinase
LGGESALALLLALAWTLVHRRELKARDQQRQRELRRKQAIDAALQQMSSAALAGDTALFFTAARSALQQSLGEAWQLEPHEVSGAELEERLADDLELQKIFNLADEANYSGIKPQAADFARWTDVVRHQVLEENA